MTLLRKYFVISGRDKQFIVSLPDEERVAWMWAVLAAFAIPEIGTLIRSVRICFFKSSRKPTSIQFIVVSLLTNLITITPKIFYKYFFIVGTIHSM